MRLHYIEKIKANLSIAASKKTTNLLEGLYCSVYKGRSLDFDDLRDYVIGDNHKDIDWKSSIRHGSLLVRRFVAFRRHNVMFVMDRREAMQGMTPAGETKAEVALYVMGTLGYIVSQNGDEIGATYARNGAPQAQKYRTGLSNLEILLDQLAQEKPQPSAASVPELIKFALTWQKRRMIMVVVSDIKGLSEMDEVVVKRVNANHDLLFVVVEDMPMAGEGSKYDLSAHANVPKYLARSQQLIVAEQEKRREILQSQTAMLKKYRMSVAQVGAKREIPDRLIDLLRRHNYAARH